MGVIILLAALAALVVIVLALAAREPAYAIARDASYFVAIRGGDKTPTLAPDVAIRWSGRADFCFIGGGEAYWSSFFILAGGDGARMPIDLGDAEDAYVARVAFGAPPRLALGALKLLVLIGILARPRGEASLDLQAKGYRSELMPEQAAVARLLAQKPSYAPSMVNFLAYYASARYGEGRASSGAARLWALWRDGDAHRLSHRRSSPLLRPHQASFARRVERSNDRRLERCRGHALPEPGRHPQHGARAGLSRSAAPPRRRP